MAAASQAHGHTLCRPSFPPQDALDSSAEMREHDVPYTQCTAALSYTLCRSVFPPQDALESIVEMREHDVPYHVRFEIDTDVRCGHWFTVRAKVRVVAAGCSGCLQEGQHVKAAVGACRRGRM